MTRLRARSRRLCSAPSIKAPLRAQSVTNSLNLASSAAWSEKRWMPTICVLFQMLRKSIWMKERKKKKLLKPKELLLDKEQSKSFGTCTRVSVSLRTSTQRISRLKTLDLPTSKSANRKTVCHGRTCSSKMSKVQQSTSQTNI